MVLWIMVILFAMLLIPVSSSPPTATSSITPSTTITIVIEHVAIITAIDITADATTASPLLLMLLANCS